MKFIKSQFILTTITVVLAFIVVTLGAYTRLTNAGLGCPDWPGCYGKLLVPSAATVKQTHQVALDKPAAWTEMIHRYLAGTVALLILILNANAWWHRQGQAIPVLIPSLLLLTVIGQALLGMWTVTLKLHPVVVMAHLLGGLTTLALLWLYRLQIGDKFTTTLSASERRWQQGALIGLGLLIAQIALGGWVSSNYAGLACSGFPTCNGQWLPEHFFSAFQFPHFGPNYEGGLLSSVIRADIQIIHRLGAVITGLYLLGLASVLWWKARSVRLQQLALVIALGVCGQIILGIINVTHLLPLAIAVMHNGLAALLLLALVSLCSATIANRGEWFHG